MKDTALIDSIVRQTTVLLANLATAAGHRSSLAHVADEVFARLVSELKTQGMGNKVIADMFGMALRTYHARVARLSESTTERGHSLWSAVLGHVQTNGPIARGDVLLRFARDDERVVKGVLRDLVQSGLLTSEGTGNALRYAPAVPEADEEDDQAAMQLLLVAVHLHGPLTRPDVATRVPFSDARLDRLLEQLVSDGRMKLDTEDGEPRYRADEVWIPHGSASGWEAAVYDHYQALVSAVCAKLQSGARSASRDDELGGSTYHMTVWEGHPLEARTTGFLAKMRREAVAIREEVAAYNRQHARPSDAAPRRVVAYVGQVVLDEGEANA